MPYIEQKARAKYNKVLGQLPDIESKGDLEYCIFYLMQRYMIKREVRYSTLHDTAYAAAHCSDEFRRRFLDAREDDAKDFNGDIVGVERDEL